jgi:hypothetical protein
MNLNATLHGPQIRLRPLRHAASPIQEDHQIS